MVEILRNKNLATRFQILVEIAHSGPNIQQRDIAKRLEVSPQAVSDYVGQLMKEGLLASGGRSRYRLTSEGTNWIIRIMRQLGEYETFVRQAVTNVTICAAIAEDDLVKGQTVGLEMKGGVLFATRRVKDGARGVAFSGASKGEDVGVTSIEGIVRLTRGKVTVIDIPTIDGGGSRLVDPSHLKNAIKKHQHIGAIGIEALVALRRCGVEPRYSYGVIEACIEAARCGLPFLIVCTSDATRSVLSRLDEGGLDYDVIEVAGDSR